MADIAGMKALTVKQPWALAIAIGAKPVENRSRNTKHRGPVAIHAGRAWSQRGADFLPLQKAYAAWLGFDNWTGPYGGHTAMPIDPETDERDKELIAFGAIIATASIVDSHPAAGCCAPWGEDEYAGRQTWHWVLDGARELAETIPCRGALGLWTVPEALIGLTGEQER